MVKTWKAIKKTYEAHPCLETQSQRLYVADSQLSKEV